MTVLCDAAAPAALALATVGVAVSVLAVAAATRLLLGLGWRDALLGVGAAVLTLSPGRERSAHSLLPGPTDRLGRDGRNR